MKVNNHVVLTAMCVLLFFVALSSTPSSGQSLDRLQWGAAVGGLQMSVSAAESHRADVPELQFFFRNVGEEDVVLNLGTMLANGKVQAPDRIILNIIDANGKARSFHFSGGRYGAIAGRADDYVVPLRSGSIYGLKIGLDKFYSTSINDFWPKLPPGRYRITARFEGVGAQALNPDTIGIGLMNFWKGELQSNTLTVER